MRERIIRFHYPDMAVDFLTDQTVADFQKAIGCVVTYGLRAKVNDGVELVDVYMKDDGSISAAYHTPFPRSVVNEFNEPINTLTEALDTFIGDDPIVIRAVPNTTGQYTVF